MPDLETVARQRRVSVYFSDNKIEAGHGQRSRRGGMASLGARAVNALIQVGSVLFLARLLSPEDYGLVSMVTAITGFAPALVDLGTHDAVVQRPRITEGEVSALFWITLGLGCSSALLVGACGPLIARFYHEPRLVTITVISGFTFITTALTCQHSALLRRAMKFTELGVIEVAANLLSAATAITIALCGLHYWALVMRPLAMNSFLAAGVWLQSRWIPPRPTMTRGVKDMLRFGLHSTGFTMTDFAGKSSDRIAIGHSRGARALGYYQNAMFVYDNLVDVLTSPLHGVAIASLSKVRDDLAEVRRLWKKALSTTVFYSMPAFGLLAVTSRDLIVLLLGAKWSNAGVLLSILALRGIPHTVERTLGWLHVSSGRTDRWMYWGVFSTSAQLVALFCGLPFGPTGVAVAYVVCMFGLFVPAIAYAGRPFDIRAIDVIKAVWRPLVGSLTAAAVGFILRYTLLTDTSRLVRTESLALAYMAVYLVIVVRLLGVRAPLEVALLLARDLLPRRLMRHLKSGRNRIAPGWGDMKTAETGSQGAGFFQKVVVGIDTPPWSAAYRTLIGFVALPAISLLWGADYSGWLLVALLLAVLLALRVVPFALRRLLPFPDGARAIWAERRGLAKRYDSYQWQKLFWIGLGLACYIVFSRQYQTSTIAVSAICLASGALGLARWQALAATMREGK